MPSSSAAMEAFMRAAAKSFAFSAVVVVFDMMAVKLTNCNKKLSSKS